MMRTVLCGVVVAGCVSPPVLSIESEIIGGTRSQGASATVLLASYPPDRSVLLTCTAVLVSPTVLLTAAHCVDPASHAGHIFGVFTGDDASGYPTLAELEPHLIAVGATHAHPEYSTQAPFFADIGVAVLASPSTIAPVPMQLAPLDASIAGTPAHILGYGQTVYEQPNQARYEATTVVVGLDADTVVVGDAQRHACLGDSGGPAIVDGRVIGVDSYGAFGCVEPAHYRRVDYFLPFLQQHVPPAEPEPEPEPEDEPDAPPPPFDEGGCSTSGGAGWFAIVALAMLVPRRRRARR